MEQLLNLMSEKKVLVLTVGASNSGKTTFANELLKNGEGNIIDLNRDTIRQAHFTENNRLADYKFTKAKEKSVTSYLYSAALSAVEDNDHIIVSDTNLSEKTRKTWIDFAKEHGYHVVIKTFDVPAHICIARSFKRDYTVPPHVIKAQCKLMRAYLGKYHYVPDTSKPLAICVDVDGTLTDMTGIRGAYDWDKVHLDTPRKNIVNLVNMYARVGFKILVLSGRDGICKEMTANHLKEMGVIFHKHYQRAVNDPRCDTVVKEEIFREEIAPNFNVAFCLDDRNKVVDMWREIGLECLQVQEGAF